MKVVAATRSAQGSSASRRLRRANKVPGILFGGSVNPTSIELDHNPLYHSLRVEAFHSTVLDMELDGKAERVILRDVQWHAYKPQVLHVDFQRVTADTRIHKKVPLHFINQDTSPAVKVSGAIVSHVLTELDVICLASNRPDFIEVDLSALTAVHPMHLSSVKLPEGVKPVVHGNPDPVLVTAVAKAEEEAAPAAAAAAPAAAPAKGKAKK